MGKSGFKRKWTKGNSKRQNLSKKQRKDLKQYGELEPAEFKSTGRETYTKVNPDVQAYKLQTPTEVDAGDSSSGDEEEEVTKSQYQELLQAVDDSNQLEESLSDSDASDVDHARRESDSADDSEQDNTHTDNNVASEGVGEGKDTPGSGDEGDMGADHTNMESDSDADSGEEDTVSATGDSNESAANKKDPFSAHIEVGLDEAQANELKLNQKWSKTPYQVDGLGSGSFHSCCDVSVPRPGPFCLENACIKKSLLERTALCLKHHCSTTCSSSFPLADAQKQLLHAISNYQDLWYSGQQHQNAEEIRFTYCLHALNHLLKSRQRILYHNSKIKKKDEDIPESYRDQGLTRPKVLILVPFRGCALRIVNMLATLLFSNEKSLVGSRKRFNDEYGFHGVETVGKKPVDYEKTFHGNIDEHFRLGLSVAKKSLRLYSKFYESDIIIASPVGLKEIIGAEGNKDRDFDFLSSIEILILDQVDVLYMQNWEHVLSVVDHVNLQPTEAHDADFSRVRMWALEGHGRLYRQTLMFSALASPDIRALFNKRLHNYAGKIELHPPQSPAAISHIVTSLPQVFHRFLADSMVTVADDRFEFFKTKIFAEIRNSDRNNTVIFMSSYFDYVRVRNHLKHEEVDCVKLCEYSKDKDVVRARGLFFHKKVTLLLLTERFHFYRRYRIRGIKHIIFYDLPMYSHFYSELCNMVQPDKDGDHVTCAVLFCKFDMDKLKTVLGRDRTLTLMQACKDTHMFVSERV